MMPGRLGPGGRILRKNESAQVGVSNLVTEESIRVNANYGSQIAARINRDSCLSPEPVSNLEAFTD